MAPKNSKSANDLDGAQSQGIRKSERKRKPPTLHVSSSEPEVPPPKKRKTSTSNQPQPPTTRNQRASRTSARKSTTRQASAAAAAAKKRRISSLQSVEHDTVAVKTENPSPKFPGWKYVPINEDKRTVEDEMKDRVKEAQVEASTGSTKYSASAPRRSGRARGVPKRPGADDLATSEPSAKRRRPNPEDQGRQSRSKSQKKTSLANLPPSRRKPTSKLTASEYHDSPHTNPTSPGQGRQLSHDQDSDASGKNLTGDGTNFSSLSHPKSKSNPKNANVKDRSPTALAPPLKPPLSPIMESPRSDPLATGEIDPHPSSGPKPLPTKQNNQPSASKSQGQKDPNEPTPPSPPAGTNFHPSTTLDSEISDEDLVAQATQDALPHIDADPAGRAEASSRSRNQQDRSGDELGPQYYDDEDSADAVANSNIQDRSSRRQKRKAPTTDDDDDQPDPVDRSNGNQERRKAASKRRARHQSSVSPLASPTDAPLSKSTTKRKGSIATPFNPADYEGPPVENRDVPNSEWKLPSYFFPKQPPKTKTTADPFWNMTHRLPDPNDREVKYNEKKNPVLKNTIQNTSVPDGSDEKPFHDVRAMAQLEEFRRIWNWSHLSREPGNGDITEMIDSLIDQFSTARKTLARSTTVRRNLGSHVRFEVGGWGVKLALRLDNTQLYGDGEDVLKEIREWCENAESVKTSIDNWVSTMGMWKD